MPSCGPLTESQTPGFRKVTGEYAQGAGWKVWVGLPGNAQFRQAPLKAPLPIPSYFPAASIDAADVP